MFLSRCRYCMRHSWRVQCGRSGPGTGPSPDPKGSPVKQVPIAHVRQFLKQLATVVSVFLLIINYDKLLQKELLLLTHY